MSLNENGCAKDSTESHPFGVDDVLIEIGQFGTFQRLIFLLICIIAIFNTIPSIGYAFTASTVVYRCRILECDGSEESYERPWTEFSIPKTKSGQLENCKRFKTFNSTKGQNLCNAENYDGEFETDCGNDFIFRDKEVTISNDFNIFCSDEWKLSMVGTINNFGQFIGTPLGGFVADRYGRCFVLTYGAVISAVLGCIRSFSPNYYTFVILGFLDNLFGATLYATAFILGLEIVGPKVRVAGCTLISMCFGIGGFLLAVVAKNVHNWRLIERAFYMPALGFIALPWILPESFRWLLSQGDEEKAIQILQKTARINKRKLSESIIEKLLQANRQSLADVKTKKNNKFPIGDAFKMFPWRIINCSLCWFTNVMVYFGLNLNSAFLGGDKYNVFMFLNLIEIPGMLLPFLMMDRYGRRNSLCGFMFLSGICIIAMTYVTSNHVTFQLILYLLGKMTISASFQTLYFFTSEIFPTNVRNSLLSFCSMVGRFGSMVAPLTPLMVKYYASAPAFLFASCAILSGTLALFLPETKDIVLPTTLQDAKKMGQKEIKGEPETKEKLLPPY